MDLDVYISLSSEGLLQELNVVNQTTLNGLKFHLLTPNYISFV